MAKIAYLIQAHHEPELCLRLIDGLDNPQNTFFIHWDKKSELDCKKFKRLIENRNNIHIYSEYKMFWMGYSLVAATILLMRKALELEPQADYLVLMSGQDYAIKSANEINEFYSNSQSDYISLNKLAAMGSEFLKKTDYHHFLESDYWNPKSPQKNNILFKLYFGIYMKKITKWLPKRKMYQNWTPFFGSQWFSFTYQTSKFIIDFIDKNPDYVKFMKTVEAPDEIFFQTIIGNTKLFENIGEIESYKQHTNNLTNNNKYIYKWGSLKFMDWESPNRAKPATLDMRDYDALTNSHFLFCRKVSEKDPKSKELLDQLDIFLGKKNI